MTRGQTAEADERQDGEQVLVGASEDHQQRGEDEQDCGGDEQQAVHGSLLSSEQLQDECPDRPCDDREDDGRTGRLVLPGPHGLQLLVDAFEVGLVDLAPDEQPAVQQDLGAEFVQLLEPEVDRLSGLFQGSLVIDVLRSWQNKAAGAAVILAIVAGTIGALILKLFGG